MLITRKSAFTGKVHHREMNVTHNQLQAYYERNVALQNAFPNLSADDREFIKTGVTPEEWDAMMGGEG